MRLLCVGRHVYLSEHLCRFFARPDVQCEHVVGLADVVRAAASLEPHLVVAEIDLLSPSIVEAWSVHRALRDVPVLAVSLSRRPDECVPSELFGIAGVIYLPHLDAASTISLLAAVARPRGIDAPADLIAVPPQVAATP